MCPAQMLSFMLLLSVYIGMDSDTARHEAVPVVQSASGALYFAFIRRLGA